MDSPKHPDSWFIQTKADEIQGFSRFFQGQISPYSRPYQCFKDFDKNEPQYILPMNTSNPKITFKGFSRYFIKCKPFFNSRLFKGFQGLSEPCDYSIVCRRCSATAVRIICRWLEALSRVHNVPEYKQYSDCCVVNDDSCTACVVSFCW